MVNSVKNLTKGSGAFTYGAGKCMSGAKGPLKANQGKMSSAHGQQGQSKNNNMSHNTGGYRIGEGTRTFKSGDYCIAGPNKPYPRHGSQPSGHKDKA
jgi:hypothetical protein